ncbi:MAG: hypothetical protein ACRDJH_24500 [Thermomicrobiales bacterium]
MDKDADTNLLRIAAFLTQALDLDDEPSVLAADLLALKHDTNAGIWTIELESSIGPAAFLVYHYQRSIAAADGRTGQDLFDADLATLEQAGERDTPGPRILAHAVAENEAFILATTPATYRALTGESTIADREGSVDDLPRSSDPVQTRRDAASELLTLLGSAERQAQMWLSAIGAQGTPRPGDSATEETIEFTEEESALALFLLDDRGIQHVLRTLNLLLDIAHRRAANAPGLIPRD